MFAAQIGHGLDLSGIAKSITAIFDTYLEPGQSIQPHYHTDQEEIYYVISGKGIVTISDEQEEIFQGDVVHIPAMAPHTLINTTTMPLRFVTITSDVTSQNKQYDAHTGI